MALDEPNSLDWAHYDDPQGLQDWAKNKIEGIDPSLYPALWIKAVAASVWSMEISDRGAENRSEIEKAIELSQDLSVDNSYLFRLLIAQINLLVSEEYGVGAVIPIEHREKIYEKKIDLAETLNLPAKKAVLKVALGLFLIESNQQNIGIKTMHEAIRDLAKAPDASEFDLMISKDLYAVSLGSLGSRAKSRAFYEELEAFCGRTKLRSFCIRVDHNYAYFLIDEENILDHEQSIKLLKRALISAEDLKHSTLIAALSNSLMSTNDRLGKYEEAKKYGLRAIEGFTASKEGMWLADSQMKMGSVLINLKQPELALKYLQSASEAFPLDYYSDQYFLANTRVKAYKMLKNFDKAFADLSYLAHANRENTRRNQNSEIAQYLTQINLELEEEQSRSLTEAENLQKIQDKLNLINREEQANTLLLINGIWVVSGLLTASGVFGLIWIWQQNKHILRLNRYLREDILQRFLPPVIAERVASGQTALDEIPHEHQVTPLFGRLVGLEHAIEELGPRVTARLLESLMQAVTDVSILHHGCLDKLHRGSFLILFGAPIHVPVEDQIAHATAFAHAILDRFNQIQESWPTVEGWRPGLAIGIHQGPALVGVFGGKRRADYTAIGQTVNLAARIEGEAKSGEIMVSEKVAQALQGQNCRSLGEVKLKGIAKAQRLYIVEAVQVNKNVS